MAMLVMHVRNMRVRVHEGAVPMRMGVRFARRIVGAVIVLVMLVMRMDMRVDDRQMDVLVLVPFRQMQPDARRHERAREPKLQRGGPPGREDPHECAKEPRRWTKSARSRAPH